MEAEEDCGATIEMIRAACQAVIYRERARFAGAHRERFVKTAIACSARIGVLAEEICANRQAGGPGGSCA